MSRCCGWRLIAFLALALFAVVAGWAPSRSDETTRNPSRKVVPDLRGKPLAVAQQLLRLSDLQAAHGVFYIAPQNWREDILPGVVYLQTPQPRSVVREGDVIGCWTFEKASSTRRTLRTPDVTGKNLKEASEALSAAGLKVATAIVGLTPDSAKEQLVGDQYPAAGQTVFEGVSVFLRSKGD